MSKVKEYQEVYDWKELQESKTSEDPPLSAKHCTRVNNFELSRDATQIDPYGNSQCVVHSQHTQLQPNEWGQPLSLLQRDVCC